MKRLPLALLLAALAVSLWFNWQNKQQTTGHSGVPMEGTLPSANPAPVFPVKPEQIDFSGTGFADESWKLDSAAPPDKIPGEIPPPGVGFLPAIPPPPPAKNWDLEGTLQLAPGKSP